MRSMEVLAPGIVNALRPPDYVDVRFLVAGVAEVHTIPAGAAYVLFSANGDFYTNFNAAAAVPAADVTDGTGSEMNPTIRYINGGTSIGIIAPQNTIVTLAFYKAGP